MPLCAEVDQCLTLIDKVQSRVTTTGGRQETLDGRLLSQVNNDINTLLSVLKNPVFRRMCKIQDTVTELGNTLSRHPSVTTNDFDITPEGNLILKITPPTERFRPAYSSDAGTKQIPSSKSTTATKSPAESPAAPPYAQELERILQRASQGRVLHSIRLFKTEGSSLGFSVVGLKSQEKGELGIFVQEIQPNGIAARDGSLRISDQILAIDGRPLDSAITHQQAIGILQQTRGEVEIVVARAPDSVPSSTGEPLGVDEPPPQLLSAAGATCKPAAIIATETAPPENMVLNTEWAEVEVVELINDGTGLGFGIIGGRSTGVVVKTILPGGVADRCQRLQSGDHILQIGDVNLVGMGSEQVAAVLRQCGNVVRLVVARPVEPSSPDFNSPVPIVPTKILGDPEELERHLMQQQANGYHHVQSEMEMRFLGGDERTAFESLPEVEIVDVELKKDLHGLGITIAGYVCEKEELSGIFIKSISEGSAADMSGRIAINDRIVEVDGQSLQGYTNHQAVEVLRQTGHVVGLKLERYHHGSKYEQLQSAISHSEHKPPTPSSVSALSLPQVPVDSDGESEDILETGYDDDQPVETRNSEMDLEDLEMLIDTRYEGEILATVEAAIMAKWSKIMGPECDIVVSQLSKAKNGGGLGISLEGTVDVEDGREVRPHHYIRSILLDGPVGKSQKLQSGDELLEVNGRRLLGLNHVEVVGILKDLPMHVRIVCARRPGQPPPSRPIDTSQDKSAFAGRNILGGSLQNLFQGSDRMVKAKSDGSLASTGTTGGDTSLSKLKSRSLEPLSGLAMWSSEPHIIELPKGDRGLGFSILDYQDPMNPSETVIVIRSLVPGGVAQQDQRLIPGDRLLAVNDTNLENASLDQAVQALKGAPKGVVRIVVAKPLPLPDTSTVSPTQSFEDTPPPPPLPSSPPPEQISEDKRTEHKHQVYEEQEFDQFQPSQLNPIPPVVTERLISTSSSNRTDSIQPALQKLPPALERNIRVRKTDDQLGVNVELAGVNGLLVSGIAQLGAIAADGRIAVGDYILSINGESLRGVSNEEARGVLRRAQTCSKELSISYIPQSDADVHKSTVLIQQSLDRTPADGKESAPAPTTISIKSTEPPSNPVAATVNGQQLKHSETSTLYISSSGRVGSTSIVSQSPPFSQPQVTQKRVVTHVTIFPSPPDAANQNQAGPTQTNLQAGPTQTNLQAGPTQTNLQAGPTAAPLLVEKVTAKMSTTAVPTRISRDNSVDEESSKKDSTGSSSTPKLAAPAEEGAAALLLAKHWGPERLVELQKEPNKSLGISIVGGKVDLYSAGASGSESSSAISGIFIKNVLPNSPAGRTGQLKTGDRILAVDSFDLRSASHEKAVEVIRAAGNPVLFLVQSLVQWSEVVGGLSTEESETSKSEDTESKSKSKQAQSQESTTTTSKSCTSSSSGTTQTKNNNDQNSSSSSSSSTESEKLTQEKRDDGVSMDGSDQENAIEEDREGKPASRCSGGSQQEAAETTTTTEDDEDDLSGRTITTTRDLKLQSTERHSSEEEDQIIESSTNYLGKTRSRGGVEIDRSSAANLRPRPPKSSKHCHEEEEDEFGYTRSKIERRWSGLVSQALDEGLSAELIVDDLQRNSSTGLGISLAGHVNRLKMAVLIVGLNPQGSAHKSGILSVGDEILEVNGNVLHSRSHLNASALIKSLPQSHVVIVALRKSNALSDLSVKPVVVFPTAAPEQLDQEKPAPHEKYSKYPGLRTIHLTKSSETGLGIMIMEGRHPELGKGIFVSDIQPESAAQVGGLLVGDLILAVNHEDILGCDYDHAAAVLKRTEGQVSLLVCNAAGETTQVRRPSGGLDKPKLPPKPTQAAAAKLTPSPSKLTSLLTSLRKSPTSEPTTTTPQLNLPPSTSPNSQHAPQLNIKGTSPRSTHNDPSVDYSSCPILPGRETTIEINKDRGLGLSILGGVDTLLGAIIIQEVYEDGAAARDGRLKPGDVILYVNNEDFQNITHSRALAALRQTPSRIRMTVHREQDNEDLYDVHNVELVKKIGKGLGLSIVSRKSGPGVYISDVVHGGEAEADGRLAKGDRILGVNGRDLKGASQEEAAAVLKTAMGVTSITVGRFRSGMKRESSGLQVGGEGEGSDCVPTQLDSLDSMIDDKTSVKTVTLSKNNSGLGFSIVGGYQSPAHGNLPIYVKTVFATGSACGLLKRGDQIVSVNSLSLEGKSHSQVVEVLKSVEGDVVLQIVN